VNDLAAGGAEQLALLPIRAAAAEVDGAADGAHDRNPRDRGRVAIPYLLPGLPFLAGRSARPLAHLRFRIRRSFAMCRRAAALPFTSFARPRLRGALRLRVLTRAAFVRRFRRFAALRRPPIDPETWAASSRAAAVCWPHATEL
jgi:hypothetical protein